MNGPNNPIGWTDFTWNPIKGLCPVDYIFKGTQVQRYHQLGDAVPPLLARAIAEAIMRNERNAP